MLRNFIFPSPSPLYQNYTITDMVVDWKIKFWRKDILLLTKYV